MSPIYLSRHVERIKKVPLWKWAVIIFLVFAMPLFFSFIRTTQIQQIANATNPQPANSANP